MSTGGDAVNSSVPVFPARVRISTSTFTPNVDSPAIAPDTTTVAVVPGDIPRLFTDNSAARATLATTSKARSIPLKRLLDI
jgi:hypothetical protein